MASQPSLDRSEIIARLNDRARLGLDSTARTTLTRNCLAAFCDLELMGAIVVQVELLAAFRNCDFASDSPERDFAEVIFRDLRVWVKIDYFDQGLEYGSEDPANPEITTRVVTILCRVGAAHRRAAPP